MSFIPLSQLLDAYQPVDAEQQQAKTKMQQFLQQHEDCFERTCAPGHFTGSAWLLDQSGEHALLLFHRKLQIWLQPGGHCDGNPDVLQVAIQEAQEESGIQAIAAVTGAIFDLDIHEIPSYGDDPGHLHYDVRFLLQVQSDEQPQSNHESEALQWFSKDREQLPTNEKSVLQMFNKWITLP